MDKNSSGVRKRKVHECQDEETDEGSRVTKEAKRDTSSVGHSSYNMLALHRLIPEDFITLPICNYDTGEEDNFEKADSRRVSRGTLWSCQDAYQGSQEIPAQLYVACNRFKRGSSSECETQTYYFTPNSRIDTSSHTFVEARPTASKDKDLVRVCCVKGCGLSSDGKSSASYCDLPSNKAERLLWADILGLEFNRGTEDEVQEICSNHFDARVSPQNSMQKDSQTPKSKTRKKRTCDILIAEEAEKVRLTMTTGRPKRTPKPNRNYDWAELTPLIKKEVDNVEISTATPKSPAKSSVSPGRRKQPIDVIETEKENEVPLLEMHMKLENEARISDTEADDYDTVGISLPSLPRAPPPKPKGRPHRIQDTCTQTDDSFSSSRCPLREVKVQCNLTAKPLVTCSSCSSIDWQSLDEKLCSLISVLQEEISNPTLSRFLNNALPGNIKPSHAANVLKMIAGMQRDTLENGNDIAIISNEDVLEEVEIEKFIHQEDAPIVGIREITAKCWNKKIKEEKEVMSVPEEDPLYDPDSLGLKEATDKDDDEFRPDDPVPEDEEDEELDADDYDWDIRNEDQSGGLIQRKKKKKMKATTLSRGKSEEEVNHAVDKKNEGTIQNRRRRHGEGDTRWIRQEHRCSECNIVFSTRRKYDLHYNHVHLGVAPWQGSHQCGDCGKTFTQKVSLNVHRMFKHGAPRRFQCTKCCYEAPTKEYLKRHMKVHTGERQYVCQECGKGLKTAESHRNHMVLHTNEGRFYCSLCKKAFNHKGAYTDHLQSHQESRNFACYCGASFKVYKHVARHIRAVHLNDKRFICDICGTQHMTGFNLKNHQKKHGDISYLPYIYQCHGCEEKFRGQQGLMTHLKVIHNTKSSEVSAGEASSKFLATVHPSRRPSKFQYCVSDTVLTNESVEDNEKSQEESILVSCDENFLFTDNKEELKTEEIVYNVSEENDYSKQFDDQNFIVADSDDRERVIHIFPCTGCSLIFSSESLRQNHMVEVHSGE